MNSVILCMFDLATFIVGMLITIVLGFIAYILYTIKQSLDEEVKTEINLVPLDQDEYEEFDP